MDELHTSSQRRNFLVQAGNFLGLCLFTGVTSELITSCQKKEGTTNSVSSTGTTKDVDISQYAELQNDFGAVKIKFSNLNSNMPVIIIRISAGVFIVLSSMCTHQGCEVGMPNSTDKTITCPCHGSVYSEVDGTVKNGPAPNPLHLFKSNFNSSTNILTITF